MGWLPSFGGGVSDENKSTSANTLTNQNMNYSGQQTPIIDPQYQAAYDATKNNLNPTGATTAQQAAIDYAQNRLTNNPVQAATTAGNAGLIANQNAVGDLTKQWNDAANQTVSGQQGSTYAGAYESPYLKNVVDTTLANYDANTGNQLNALRASRGAGSAFGDRANLSDGSFLSQNGLNRAQTEAGLRDTAFNTAQGYGQQDAGRFQAADIFNATNRQNALQGASESLKQSAGLTQQVVDNVVKQDGIDTAAAQDLFQAGQITQQQLAAIMQAAGSFNGQSAAGDQRQVGTVDSTGHSNAAKIDTNFSL